MSNIDLDSTYEKMYNYEEEIKNSISIKTQLLFTAIFILISTAVYLARFLDFSTKPDIAYIITFLVCLVVITAAASTYFNCKAFSGSEFNRMPYAIKVQEYYDDQVKYNIEVEQYNSAVEPEDAIESIDPKKETENFITKTYINCATHNALINEQRSRWWFKAFAGFLIACIPLAVASLLFVVFDMDTSSPRKNFSVKDSYVGGEIASLRSQLANSPSADTLADLQKRTIILERILLEQKESQMSDSKKTTSNEKQSKPQAPVKPSAPPSRVAYDDVNGGPNRSAK
ncbi:MAG: hypothetical protein ACLGJA_03965 [Gammaproteobacteria bacterium]